MTAAAAAALAGSPLSAATRARCAASASAIWHSRSNMKEPSAHGGRKGTAGKPVRRPLAAGARRRCRHRAGAVSMSMRQQRGGVAGEGRTRWTCLAACTAQRCACSDNSAPAASTRRPAPACVDVHRMPLHPTKRPWYLHIQRQLHAQLRLPHPRHAAAGRRDQESWQVGSEAAGTCMHPALLLC